MRLREVHKVSLLEVPPFDLLGGQPAPYMGFGEPLPASTDLESELSQMGSKARQRISDLFGVGMTDPSTVPERLEAILARMWSQGWQPDDYNVNLFATDFGSILTDALHRTLRGTLIFRSRTDLSHASLRWDSVAIEAFPFHRMLRRLIHQDGDSLSYYARRLAELLNK